MTVMGQDLDAVAEDGNVVQLEKLQWAERKLAKIIARLA